MHLGKGAKQENEKNETSYIRGKGGEGVGKRKEIKFRVFLSFSKTSHSIITR